MLISRRALGTLAGGAVLGLVTGCTSNKRSPARASANRLEWLRGLDGVEKAELVADGDDPDDQLIRLTLVKQLSDHDVNALVGKIKKEFRPYSDDYHRSIEVAVDGFHGRFYPAVSTRSDPDLERALWLRRDGRATSSTYGTSGMIVSAPPAAVAVVALGFDQAVESDDGRRTHRVESADRAVVVEWTDSPSAGFQLDRAATRQFVDLQSKYPNLTGWIEGPERRAGVYFAATDIELDALLAALPTVVDASRFSKLQLGWGPVRAPSELFATAFTPTVRMLVGHLMKIPGVTGIEIRDDYGTPEVDAVTVKDRAGFLATVSTLRKVWPSYLRIQLIRRRSKFVGQEGRTVFRTSSFHRGSEYRIHAAVADLTGVTEVDIGPYAANLTIAEDITDPELATALTAMAERPAANTLNLSVSDGPDEVGITSIGRVANRKYVARNPMPPRIDPALITRVTTAWNRAAR
ncbi:hypothetical protein EV652_114236 [Kribbella steppae]|uniref:Uncharacterized protein n=1 Tax=Kribbella steppae TaxID=2512223 RepID=A0A4R2H300_9ACTN|nr:hypothetical protein [Kribbella steppae]TCO19255.1 hypothetical protein EV652_114236 [Kribbella steppae]